MSMSVVALICHFRNETLATEFVKTQDRLDKLKLLQTQAFRFLFLFKKKKKIGANDRYLSSLHYTGQNISLVLKF